MTGAPNLTVGELTTLMQTILANGLLPVGEDFTPDTNLVESGLDSMAVAQLLLEIESKTGVWLDESLLTPENLASCRTLALCVHGLLSGQRGPG